MGYHSVYSPPSTEAMIWYLSSEVLLRLAAPLCCIFEPSAREDSLPKRASAFLPVALPGNVIQGFLGTILWNATAFNLA